MATPVDVNFNASAAPAISATWLNGISDWVNGAYSVLGASYSSTAFRGALSAAASGANTDITSVGAITGVTAAAGDNTTKLATTAFVLANSLSKMTTQSASGVSSVEFTNIPSWVKRVTVTVNGISGSGTSSAVSLTLSTASGYETSYTQRQVVIDGGVVPPTFTVNATTAEILRTGLQAAAATSIGKFVLELHDTNTWVGTGTFYRTSDTILNETFGSVTLVSALTALKISISTGTFDAGSFSVLYE